MGHVAAEKTPGTDTATAPGIAVVSHAGQALPEMLRDLFAAADPGLTITRHDNLTAALATRPAAPVLIPVLIPVRLPVAALSDTLEQGRLPSEALTAWSAQTGTLLGQCRRNRRNVLLIDTESLARNPAGLVPALFARLGMTPPAIPPATDTPAPVRPTLELLAHALLEQNPTARAMADELEAMALSAADPALMSVQLLDQACREYRQQAQESELAQATAELSQERDLLRESLALIQAELTAQVEAAAARSHKSREIQAELLLHTAAHEAAKRQLQTALDDRLQREAVLGAQILGSQANLTQLRQQVEHLSDELERVYASRSWRITAPLRRLRGGA